MLSLNLCAVQSVSTLRPLPRLRRRCERCTFPVPSLSFVLLHLPLPRTKYPHALLQMVMSSRSQRSLPRAAFAM
jgi:hypothetical protein